MKAHPVRKRNVSITAQRHGECNSLNGICRCNLCYFGDDCTMLNCDSGCSNNGKCDYTTGKCTCNTGLLCEKKTYPNNCSGHGLCTNTGLCLCDTGYTSEDCILKLCIDDCNNIYILISRKWTVP
jgi:hypothetical protein